MRFARVSGTVRQLLDMDGAPTGWLELRVALDTGSRVEQVRHERVATLAVPDGQDALAWQADQYTQETIGNELSLDGWEPLGVAPDDGDNRAAALIGSSPTYIVRQSTDPQ